MLCHPCAVEGGSSRERPRHAKPPAPAATRGNGARCYSSADSRPLSAGPVNGYRGLLSMPLPTVVPRRLRGLSLLTLLVAGLAGSAHVLAADLLDLD